MTVGTSTFKGLALPRYGEAELTQQTLGTDILTITGASSQTGDFVVCRNSSGTENFVVDKDGDVSMAGLINKMVLTTVALATLASNASSTATLTGITTNCAVMVFPRAAATTDPMPVVWPDSAGKLGFGAGGIAQAAKTVNVWFFETA